jgi:hypothetical protein
MGFVINGNLLLVRVGVFSMSYIKRDITLVNYMRRCAGSLKFKRHRPLYRDVANIQVHHHHARVMFER